MPRFTLEDVKQPATSVTVPTLVKYHDDGRREEWGNVQDFDQLFDTCVSRWGSNWDLNKVCTAIRECDFN